MKKSLIFAVAIALSIPAFSQTFKKGDMVADLGIGAGLARVTDCKYDVKDPKSKDVSRGTFTQQLGFEVGVLDFSDDSSLGFGVNINNAYGANHTNFVAGAYDYNYMFTTYTKNSKTGRWQIDNTRSINRQGNASAYAKKNVDNLNVMFKLAYHRQFIDNLDTYVAIGFGIESRHTLFGDLSHEVGLSSATKSFDKNYNSTYQSVYSYNDADHVEWTGSKATVAYAIAAYVGARYYLTENWGVNLNLGLNSMSFKKDFNNCNILSVGASYKF